MQKIVQRHKNEASKTWTTSNRQNLDNNENCNAEDKGIHGRGGII